MTKARTNVSLALVSERFQSRQQRDPIDCRSGQAVASRCRAAAPAANIRNGQAVRLPYK
jgi:hypothetical protein